MSDTAYGLNVRNFGAKGDGSTDDTAAFRAALAEAGKIEGTVFVPEGVYLCGELKMPPHTGLCGNPTWAYRSLGGTLIRLNNPAAECLIDVSDAPGATLTGLSLDGGGLGTGIHGIFMRPFDGTHDKKEEDVTRIERCYVTKFTGDGVHLAYAWCFSIRSCELIANTGNGVYVKGWDGFILDNWFSGNGGAGYCSDQVNSAVTITGNRIEWNAKGGIAIYGGTHYNITGNYIDRSGGPAIALRPRDGAPCHSIAMTGNVIYRSGRPEWTGDDPLDSAHVRFDGCHGIVFSANTMCVGQDDGGGTHSPKYGMVLHNLKNSIVKSNTLHIGAIDQLIMDLGGHDEGVVIAENPGSIYTDLDAAIWNSDQC